MSLARRMFLQRRLLKGPHHFRSAPVRQAACLRRRRPISKSIAGPTIQGGRRDCPAFTDWCRLTTVPTFAQNTPAVARRPRRVAQTSRREHSGLAAARRNRLLGAVQTVLLNRLAKN